MKNYHGTIKEIDYKTAIDFIMPRHYANRKPQYKIAFGWYDENNVLKAVCCFGKPASPTLCKGILGENYSSNVYELNRLVREEDWNYPLSQLVGYSLRQLKKYNWIIVSYSDTAMHHNGYIYQACNFLYTGQTKKRTDKYTKGNKHSRHYNNEEQNGYRKIRSAKNRYVYFCTSNKKLKKEWFNNLKYPILQYPKEENKNYKLGEFLKPDIIKTK